MMTLTSTMDSDNFDSNELQQGEGDMVSSHKSVRDIKNSCTY